MKTLIWLSLKILCSPTSKLNQTMLHFNNTSSDRSLSHILALFGRSTMPPWLKTLSTGALKPQRTWKWTCWQNLQVRVQVQVHSFQVQVQARVLRAQVQVQVQQKWT